MRIRTRAVRLGVAVAILATVATPVARAAASDPQASSSASSMLKQIKALQKATAVRFAEVAALQAKAAELEGREPVVNSLPAGPAGGDLSGSYPNPTIRANSITSANLLDGTLLGSDFGVGSVQPSDIADHVIGSVGIQNEAIDRLKLAASSVGTPQLNDVDLPVKSQEDVVGNNEIGRVSATCPAGERLLGGGLEWRTVPANGSSPATNGVFTIASIPDMANPNQWDVVGINGSGSARALFSFALCLKGS
jgi:hypothetical protein